MSSITAFRFFVVPALVPWPSQGAAQRAKYAEVPTPAAQKLSEGQLLPVLERMRTIAVSTAASDRSSFGCKASNDCTFFGDALINHGFRQPVPSLDLQLRPATVLISAAEDHDNLQPSNPAFSIGSHTSAWLTRLKLRQPTTTPTPVGQSDLGLETERT